MISIRLLLSAAFVLALGPGATGFAQVTPPKVLHAPSDDGIPHSAEFQIGAPGPHTLNLWLSTGPLQTPQVSNQEVCNNGVGDESCGLYAVVTTTGGVTITSFSPESGVSANEVSSTELRIVRLGAAEPGPGDFGALRLGTLVVNRVSEGDVVLSSASRWVRADLVMESLAQEDIVVPEPSAWLMLVSALALLGLLKRVRASGAASVVIVSGTMLLGVPGADAQIYRNQAALENALGGSYSSEDFEGFAFDGDGNAALSNGATLGGGGCVWESITLTSDIDLWKSGGFLGSPSDTGLDGTLLIRKANFATPDKRGHVGGHEAGPPGAGHDDFRLLFDPPVAAAGVFVAFAPSSSEFVEFRDAEDNALVSFSNVNGGYFGYILAPGQNPIASIVVESEPGDDLEIDDVIWAETVELETDTSAKPAPKLQDAQQYNFGDLGFLFGYGATNQFRLGMSAAGIGDLNRDGVPDFALGAEGVDIGGSDRGSVWLGFLERDGTLKSWRAITESSFSGPGGVLADGDFFGRSVESLGDLDGDGVLDLAVGTKPSATPGDVYILFMKRDGRVKAWQRIDEADGGFTGAIEAGDRFGVSIANLGDLDGDGIIDLAVGATRDSDGGGDAGAVWILFLDSDGTVKSHTKIAANDPSLGGLVGAGDLFGGQVEGVGDLNRDGVPDVAVSAPWDDDGGTNRGAVYILFLNDDGTVASSVKHSNADGTFGSIVLGGFAWGALQDNDTVGWGLAWIPTPQFDLPGVLAVGVQEFDTFNPLTANPLGPGAVFFLALDADGTKAGSSGLARTIPPAGATVPGAFQPPAGESDFLGSALANLGDVDGDGFTDLLAGASGATFGGDTGSGAGYLMFLSGIDPTAFADAVHGSAGNVCHASRLLGSPNNSGATIRDGGQVTLQMVDNIARPDGTALPDLYIYRYVLTPLCVDNPSIPGNQCRNTITISVSEDGGTFHQALSDSIVVTEEVIPVDLDAAPTIGPDSQVRLVRIEVADACTANCLAFCSPNDPPYDAIEPADNLNRVYDRDLDGAPDGLDTCRDTPNPTQTDSDGDGWGDVCDNCPADGNPDQLDGDGDAKGNVCDGGEYFLTRVDDVSTLHELRYRCPGYATVDRLDVGIVMPPGTSNGYFGGPNGPQACEEPCGSGSPGSCAGSIISIPNPPVGYTPGAGCTNAIDLGVNLDPTKSGVIGRDLISPTGVRSDTLYLRLEGAPICDPNENVGLGYLYFSGSPTDVPVLTSRGVDSPGLGLDASRYELSDAFSGQEPECTNGVCSIKDPVLTAITSMNLRLRAAPGQPPGAETIWEVDLWANSEAHRLGFRLEAPPNSAATLGEFYWEGCTGGAPVAPDFARVCNGPYQSQYQARVATTNSGAWGTDSYTLGPDSADTVPTLLVSLEGIPVVNSSGIPGLNNKYSWAPLGRVVLTTTQGVPPDITVSGLSSMPVQPPLVGAYDLDFNEVPDEVSPLEITLVYSSEGSEDSDNDDVRDEDDNCRYLANTSQTNTGGLASSDPTDNIGDDCQCMDLDFDGRMLLGGPDLPILVDVLLGLNSNPAVLNRASVVDGTEANIRDAVFLQLGLDGKITQFDQVCEDGVPPVP